MNKNIIENNFNLKVSDIKLLDKHFGTELYLINTDVGKYIVKVLPLYMENVKNEGELAEYLYNHGIKVAKFLKSKDDAYVVKTPEFQFEIRNTINENYDSGLVALTTEDGKVLLSEDGKIILF